MKKTINNLLMLTAALTLNTVCVKAQTWNLVGNTNLTATSKLGGSSATAAQNFPLRLFTYNAERIHINANVAGKVGYVGIGNTAPATMLHVNGVITATGGTSTAWNTAVTRLPAGTTSKVPRWNGTAYVAGSIFDNGTNIGIGTTAPTAALQVQKSTLSNVLIKSSANGAQLTLDRSANGFDAVTRYMQTGVPQWKTGLTVNANGTPDFVIKNEISNSDALTIHSSSNYVNVNSGNFTLNSISYLYNTGNDLNIHAYAPSTFQSANPGNILLAYPGPTNKSGNVGIGTNAPTRAKLVVQGNVGKTNAIFGQGASGISLVENWPSVGFNTYYASTGWKSMKAGYGFQMSFDPTAGLLAFYTSSNASGADQVVTQTLPFVIHASGAVGINNTSAFSTLDVQRKSGTTATASFWGTNTSFASHFCIDGNENTYIRGGLTGSNVILADVGTQRVGIGTVNPAYKLDVCGTMRAKEVRVSTGWCDYVFADDYKLPSLNDVETFIKTNKHLPDVTPGAIIESEGLEVGKTAAQMIKKIEELTLYVIDLQKQVDLLKKNKN